MTSPARLDGRASRPPPTTPLELLGLAAVIGLLGAGLLLWVTGQLAARVHSGRWLTTALPEVGAVVARLLRNPGSPAASWPAPDQALLPGPVVFWLIAAAVLLATVIPGLFLWSRLRVNRGALPADPNAARWATKRDLRVLRVRRPTPGRVTLGRHPRAGLLAAEPDRSVIVFGPTRSGKTSGFAIPAILEWDGPVICTSVKADLLADTHAWRSHQGTVWIYDPTGGTGWTTNTWSPLSGCGTWQGALRTANWLASGVRKAGSSSGLSDGDFWYASAAKLLAPLLLAAGTSGRTMADVVRWVDVQEADEVTAELDAARIPEAIHAFQATLCRHDNQRSSIYTTAETVIAAYADPAVAASAATSEIDPAALVSGSANTLYICAPRHDQQRLRPLFTSLLEQAVEAATSTALAAPSGCLARRLLIVLDEAANVAPLPELAQLASTAAGYGITLVTIWQDLAQVRTRYGNESATIVNNHHALVALPGLKDLATLDAISALAGDTASTRASTTTSADGGRSRTDSSIAERLLKPHHLRGLREGQAVCLYGALPPARLRLRAWWQDHRLAARAGRAAQAQPVHPTTPTPPALPRQLEDLWPDVVAIAREYDAQNPRPLPDPDDAIVALEVDLAGPGRLLKLVALSERLTEHVGIPIRVTATH